VTILAEPGGYPSGMLEGMAVGMILLFVLGVLAVCGFLYCLHMIFRPPKRDRRRGFEVKLTDQNSVTAKKENDHG